jgi:rubrerythrin
MGGRSRAAAQLLAGQGFEEVYNLSGGIKAWQGSKAVGPADMGMVLLRGDETPVDIIRLAYGLEEGLQTFYEAMSKKKENGSSVIDLLSRLAGVEVGHKSRLYRLYARLQTAPKDQESFEGEVLGGFMEGSFTTEEFLERNESMLHNRSDVLGMAMMLEAQALDLYMRYSRKARDPGTREVIHELAEEEKSHLSSLGRLLEKQLLPEGPDY